tara:strand:- start:315 stop:731 length:417 start_codon:yes stop_codon:yes gene_type:complete
MQESLNKTWFIDIDGTIVKHWGNEQLDEAIEEKGQFSHLSEEPIKESVEFLNSIPPSDTIVLTTARDSKHEDHTLRMLQHYNIRYDRIMFDLRSGPRYLVNDIKPIGLVNNSKPLDTAFALNVERNQGIKKPWECLMT